ncbi:MAG: hypothetical protein KKG79_09220, partial [Acidobacteria bacterium]|nr:hypothetical protein [Acidobacteriota bacterium]
EKKAKLQTTYDQLNPFALKRMIDKLQERLHKMIYKKTKGEPFMPSIALNLYLHKRFFSGRLLYEATIPVSSRFLMRQCAGLTWKSKSVKIAAWKNSFPLN